jgi:hypothetical protein
MIRWSRSVEMAQRLEDKIEGDTYLGYPIIRRDTSIDGGISVGATEREAIVVDSKNDPYVLQLYQTAKHLATSGGSVHRSMVLASVYNTVLTAMPNTDVQIDAVLKHYDKGDKPVHLGYFIQHSIGVCRHHALTVGVLLELFKKDGHIRGTVSIDRNEMDGGAHMWARYTSYEGIVCVIDVTRRFLGTLQESLNRGSTWSYVRPTDKK